MSDRVAAAEGIRMMLELQKLHQREEELITLLLAESIKRLERLMESEHDK